jgi:membrane-associated phospholipid phosphatase
MYLLYFIYLVKTFKKNRDIFWGIKKLTHMLKIGLTYAIFGIIFAILKFSVNLPRPFCSMSKDNFVTIIDTSLERCLSSFPSSHVGISLLVAYFLWPSLNFAQRIIASMVVILVSISRMTLAMHYPADVLYGLIITVIIIIAGNHLYGRCTSKLMKMCLNQGFGAYGE